VRFIELQNVAATTALNDWKLEVKTFNYFEKILEIFSSTFFKKNIDFESTVFFRFDITPAATEKRKRKHSYIHIHMQ
jgi:hypothetical protein